MHSIKFTWKAEIESAIEMDKNYTIWMEWSVVNISSSSNGDGTTSKTYSFRPIRCIIHNELWETIKVKDPRKNSEKLRSKLKHDWDNWIFWTKYREFDEAYDNFFRKIYSQYDFLISDI